MADPTPCMSHVLLRYASDLRTEADKHGQLTERARLLRESADLIEIAAARDEKKETATQ